MVVSVAVIVSAVVIVVVMTMPLIGGRCGSTQNLCRHAHSQPCLCSSDTHRSTSLLPCVVLCCVVSFVVSCALLYVALRCIALIDSVVGDLPTDIVGEFRPSVCTENQMVAYYSKVVPITPADRRSPGDFCFRE